MAESPPKIYHNGTNDDDVLIGDGSNDVFYAGAGDDIMRGGGYVDLLEGGLGDDIYDGGEGEDYALFYRAYGGVRVDLTIVGPQDTGEGRDTFISIESIFGSAHGDVLKGNEAENQLEGNEGNDVLEGRGGDDFLNGGQGSDEIHGGAGNDLISGQEGNDFLYGDAGDDTFISSFGADLYDGGVGFDSIAFFTDTGITIDMALTGRQEVAPNVIVTLVSIEHIQTTPFADRVMGNSANNTFSADRGDDIIDGRGGNDVYVSTAALSDLDIKWTADGWRITDKRAVSYNEGTDLLKNIEMLRTEGGSGASRALGDGMTIVVSNLLRLSEVGGQPYSNDLSARLASGQLNQKGAIYEAVRLAAGTTSIASLSYEFFTGKIPTLVGVDYLVAPTGGNANNLNSAYYAKFDVVNRYINFAVNLGKNGEAKDSFAAAYGSLSLFDATKKAYVAIFGGTPTDDKVHSLIDNRVDYLAYYGGDGPNGIGTKSAMVGFLLAAAATEHIGAMARSNDAWLTDLADGEAPFAVDLMNPSNGYYKADFIFGG